MNTHTELEADLRFQASSPAQEDRSEVGAQGVAEKQWARISAMGGQIAKKSKRARNGQITDAGVGRIGKKGGQLSDDCISADCNLSGQIAQLILQSLASPNSLAWVGNAATPENPLLDGAVPDRQPLDGQAARWLKSLLPESQGGWWEVDVKGKGLAVKFRWRDTDRQTLFFPQVTNEQFIALKQGGSEKAARILRERVSANLHSFLLDPAKRDKALIVARKLGTHFDEYQIAGAKE